MLQRYRKVEVQASDMTHHSAVKGRSLMRDARERFLRNKAALVCLGVLLVIVIFVLFGPMLAVWDNETIHWGNMGATGVPSLQTGHFFGTDDLGRDLYSRTIQATGTSLMVGLVGAGMALIIGIAWGVIAGFYGGWVDSVMMRIVDILLAIPTVLVLILILVIAGRSFTTLFIALGAVSWLTMMLICMTLR